MFISCDNNDDGEETGVAVVSTDVRGNVLVTVGGGFVVAGAALVVVVVVLATVVGTVVPSVGTVNIN